MSRAIRPPAHLSERAQALWRRLLREFAFETHHLVTLTATLEALDRLEQAREAIATDGLIVPGREGLTRVHPAASVERDSRIAVLRGFRELGLDLPSEAARPPVSTRSPLRAVR